jgi:hypothetical protein
MVRLDAQAILDEPLWLGLSSAAALKTEAMAPELSERGCAHTTGN